MKRILITTGDADGIGFEVTAKALNKIGPKKNVQFYYYKNPLTEKKYLSIIKKKFKIKKFSSIEDALGESPQDKTIFEIESSSNPALCFEEGVKYAKNKFFNAIVTAPLSKELIQEAGLSDRGHTDIMRRILNQEKNIYMAFIGNLFSLILVSDHLSIRDVPSKISKDHLLDIFSSADAFLKNLKLPKNKQRIGVLGLNPHAGEIKNLGFEDREIIAPAILSAQKNKFPVFGPLVPDVAFQDSHYQKYGVFIAMYHDQGLIPFKILHKKQHGVQVSLNTPFVRTSVDHGTAKDIFGKGKADAGSMIKAIQTALKLV
ncbi:MAG: 4-hydroxythreonine-4-phosphate dehydrogenase PdxA [Bdellovibrionota bacterium]